MKGERGTVAFCVALAIQLAVVGAVAGTKYLPKLVGTTVVLKTAPVDPYTILSGYYMEIS